MDDNGEQQQQQYGNGNGNNNPGSRPYSHRDYTLHYRPNGATTNNGQIIDNKNGLFSSISSGFNSLMTNLFGWSSAYRPATRNIAFIIVIISLMRYINIYDIIRLIIIASMRQYTWHRLPKKLMNNNTTEQWKKIKIKQKKNLKKLRYNYDFLVKKKTNISQKKFIGFN